MLAKSAVSGELKVPFYAAIGSTLRANIELFQPYFWQTQANATMEACAAAEHVAKKPEPTRISVLGSDYEWGHGSVTAFTERLKELRPDIVFADPVYTKVGGNRHGALPHRDAEPAAGCGVRPALRRLAGGGAETRPGLRLLRTNLVTR